VSRRVQNADVSAEAVQMIHDATNTSLLITSNSVSQLTSLLYGSTLWPWQVSPTERRVFISLKRDITRGWSFHFRSLKLGRRCLLQKQNNLVHLFGNRGAIAKLEYGWPLLGELTSSVRLQSI